MSTAFPPGERVKSRAVNCPNCGGRVEMRGFAHTLTVTCTQCLSVLDTENESVRILKKYKEKQRVEPQIPLGSRGKWDNIDWQVTGFQERYIQVDGERYFWEEYILFNPYYGFRYLSVYQGHWNYIRPLRSLPVPDFSTRHRVVDGVTFKHFQQSHARTSFVMGEFPWKVQLGETVEMNDYVAPPYLLSCERDKNEEVWSKGEYVQAKDLWKAFQVPGEPREAQGVFANQPNPREGQPGRLWKLYALFALVSILALVFMGASEREVFHDTYRFQPDDNAEPAFVTKPFDVSGGVKVQVTTDIDNNWAAFNLALINEKTNEAYDFGTNVSFYRGYDDGESWSEGSRESSVPVGRIPDGRYYLRIEPDRDQEPSESKEQFARPIRYDVRVKDHDYGGSVIFAIFLLLIPPIWISIKSWSFEQKRWAESDYAPVSTDSSGGDDD
jgi:hypothetical protein